MLKSQELSNPTSCLSRARRDEFIFTLLGRDIAAPATIRNQPDDQQIICALGDAAILERNQESDATGTKA